MNPDKKIKKIDDPRIASYTKRTRSGTTQVFYTGSDERDWKRYNKDREKDPHAPMHEKTDTIRIEPPKNSYYAELIDGDWWWVEGCAECNGNPRDWMTYIECEKHDVCSCCGIHRSQLTESPWGSKHGWICKPCQKRKDEELKQERLLRAQEEGINHCHTSNVVCPHCGSEVEDLYEDSNNQKHTCEVCGGEYRVEQEPVIYYSTSIVGQRILPS